ncbi:MAG: hypothetical protein R2839_10265 [Thermomicrobiales bacterium]
MQQAGLNTERQNWGIRLRLSSVFPLSKATIPLRRSAPITPVSRRRGGVLARRSHPVLTGGPVPCCRDDHRVEAALSPETRLGRWLDAHEISAPVTTFRHARRYAGGCRRRIVLSGLAGGLWDDRPAPHQPNHDGRCAQSRSREALIRATDVHVVRYQEADALTRITALPNPSTPVCAHRR